MTTVISKKIGLVDADLIDRGTNFPNLALMKISSFLKTNGAEVKLLKSFEDADNYNKVVVSKVFTKTKTPILDPKKYIIGGTGFFGAYASPLPDEIEYVKPDYDLYRDYFGKSANTSKLKYYYDYSIGYTTRGCFRHCQFCVNKNSNGSSLHSPVKSFFDEVNKKICLLDDNVLACKERVMIFDELISYNKPFVYKQGLDIRLMDPEIAQKLQASRYDGDIIFAFDNIDNKKEIVRGVKQLRNHCNKRAKSYVLCGFPTASISDLETVFERISILKEYNILPYVMRYETVYKSPLARIYSYLASWCNQPSFKHLTFGDFRSKRDRSASARQYQVWDLLDKKYMDYKYVN